MELPYGVTKKNIKGKKYSYFWFYDETGHKSETYLGKTNKSEAYRRGAAAKLQYLLNMQVKLDLAVLAAKQELAGLQKKSAEVVQQTAKESA
jgi:hypothetical protein